MLSDILSMVEPDRFASSICLGMDRVRNKCTKFPSTKPLAEFCNLSRFVHMLKYQNMVLRAEILTDMLDDSIQRHE